MELSDSKNSRTPINDFVDKYVNDDGTRLHMPGHKGINGNERDITEIHGADSLYSASGIIKQSEDAASELFGTRTTFFGTEGSSQVIRAMCFLAVSHYRKTGGTSEHPVIIAGRNAHKSFIYASMLLGFKIGWIGREGDEYSLCGNGITVEGLKNCISEYKERSMLSEVAAVYVTTPDYLGNMADVKGLSEIAHGAGLMLLCDNAHGAYLKFLSEDRHPISLGADITADSAHKTLPVLTGGAYMHISENAPESIENDGKRALLMFGSTSPSYLILESLDKVNDILDPSYFRETVKEVEEIRKELMSAGYRLYGDEPLKVTIDLRKSALRGEEFSGLLRAKNIECEYADPDFLVTMWSPCNVFPEDAKRFISACSEYINEYRKKREYITGLSFSFPKVIKQPYELVFCNHRRMEREDLNKNGQCIAADTVINCPPAISPIVCGEAVDENTLKILEYYGLPMPEIVC